jgi:dTDP-4-dehydrorhamnose 3,5-epimerase
MNFIQTNAPGLVVIEPIVFRDERGYFFESFNERVFQQHEHDYNWVQDNQSSSTYGVIRGLHFQTGVHAQAKLVRCLKGVILDVVVDLRKNSPFFKQVFAVELTAEKNNALLVPRGFAHGFSVLSDSAEVLYKCDNYYHKQSEGGLLYNDASLQIDWKIPTGSEIVSSKDLVNPSFDALKEDCFV